MILLAACAAARPAQLGAERQKQAELAPQLKKLRAACRSDDPTRRKNLENSLKTAAATKKRLQESLSKYPDRKQYEELVAAGTSALHAANRWTDNIHEMYSYVQQMCGREEVRHLLIVHELVPHLGQFAALGIHAGKGRPFPRSEGLWGMSD